MTPKLTVVTVVERKTEYSARITRADLLKAFDLPPQTRLWVASYHDNVDLADEDIQIGWVTSEREETTS